MPSDQSTWLISVPQGHDPQSVYQSTTSRLTTQAKLPLQNIGQLAIPSFKVGWQTIRWIAEGRWRRQTGTLDLLIELSEDLPKQDNFFTTTVAKTVETLRNLLNNDPTKLVHHVLVDEHNLDSYLLRGWKWKEGRYDVQKSLRNLVDILNQVRYRFHHYLTFSPDEK